MKNSLVYATLVAVFACAATTLPASAQQPQRPAAAPVAASGIGATGGVAVIDLKYIFDKHARFQAMRGELMKEVDQAEVVVKGKQEEVRKLQERLKDFRSGTPEHKQLEVQIANMIADVKIDIQVQKKEFMEREARIHYQVYQEVVDEVKYYCERSGIQLVLRFSGDPIDPNDPQHILAELNKSVFFFNPAIDITPHILQSINSRYGQPPATGAPAAVNPATAGRPAQGVPSQRPR